MFIYLIFYKKTQPGEINLYYPLACRIAHGDYNFITTRGILEVLPLGHLFRAFGEKKEILHVYMYVSGVASMLVLLNIISLYKPLSNVFLLIFLACNVMPSWKWHGGWRIFFGNLSVYLYITHHPLLSGLSSGIGFFHSIEMGILPLLSTFNYYSVMGFVLIFFLTLYKTYLLKYINLIFTNPIFSTNETNGYITPQWKLDIHVVFRFALLFLFFPLVYSQSYFSLWLYGVLVYLAAFRNIGGTEILHPLQIMFALAYLKL